MEFEDVKFEHLGKGGVEGDLTLLEQAEQAMNEMAAEVLRGDRGDTAKVTVSIEVRKQADQQVFIGGSVKVATPAHRKVGLGATVTDDGRVVTVQHKQEPLPMNVAPMRPKKAKSKED